MAAAGNAHGQITCWQTNDGTITQQWTIPAAPIYQLTFLPHTQTLLGIVGDGVLRLWDCFVSLRPRTALRSGCTAYLRAKALVIWLKAAFKVQMEMKIVKYELGGGAGIIFNATTLDNKFDSQMVRSQIADDGGTGLFWGIFDNHGVFNGQGFFSDSRLENNSDWFEVKIHVVDDRYSIILDEDILISDILYDRQPNSFVGLVTNKAHVLFRSFTLETWEP